MPAREKRQKKQPVRRDAQGRAHLVVHRDDLGRAQGLSLSEPLFNDQWQNEVAVAAANTRAQLPGRRAHAGAGRGAGPQRDGRHVEARGGRARPVARPRARLPLRLRALLLPGRRRLGARGVRDPRAPARDAHARRARRRRRPHPRSRRPDARPDARPSGCRRTTPALSWSTSAARSTTSARSPAAARTRWTRTRARAPCATPTRARSFSPASSPSRVSWSRFAPSTPSPPACSWRSTSCTGWRCCPSSSPRRCASWSTTRTRRRSAGWEGRTPSRQPAAATPPTTRESGT